MILAILWDNDGVLADTEDLYFLANRKILESVGIVLTKEMYVDLFLVQSKGAWHLAEERGILPDEITRLRAERNALYLSMLGSTSHAIDGVEEVLEVLSGKYLMGVVTSSHREPFEATHRATGFMKYFAFTLTSEDYAKYKPDPEPYLLAIRKTGFQPDECIAVEDSERGLVSARGAGLRCIVIPRGLTRSGSFNGAFKILNNIRELPAVLEETVSYQSHPSPSLSEQGSRSEDRRD